MHVARPTRREFLRLGARAGAGVALSGPAVLGGAALLGGCTFPQIPGPWLPGSSAAEDAVVAAVRGQDLFEMSRRVLAAVGGIQTTVHPGETVFIKPNLLGAGQHGNLVSSGEITKPDIVIAVAEECLRVGAKEVIIGDGAQVERFGWDELTTLDGSTNMAAAAERLSAQYDGQVTLACLNGDSPEWDSLPSPRTNLGALTVSSLVARADRIISVPVLKTHRQTRLTLSLKNFVGVTPLKRYSDVPGLRSQLHAAVGGVEACFLDLVSALRPDLAIIDASIGCEGFGPWVRSDAGRTVDMRERLGDWLLLASTDLVAADATAARIVGLEYEDVPFLKRATEEGLGQARGEMITLAGATLEELRVRWDLDLVPDFAVSSSAGPPCPATVGV